MRKKHASNLVVLTAIGSLLVLSACGSNSTKETAAPKAQTARGVAGSFSFGSAPLRIDLWEEFAC